MSEEIKEKSAVQAHINILQNIISRMAGNSANCKTWTITIVAAIIVLLIDKNKANIFYITFIPIIMFFLLDCFYLGLERHFIKLQKSFVKEIEERQFNYNLVYNITGPKKTLTKLTNTIKATLSFSTTPFYAILSLLVFMLPRLS